MSKANIISVTPWNRNAGCITENGQYAKNNFSV